MNPIGIILTGVLTLVLVLASVRSRLELNHAKPGYSGCLGVIGLSFLLVVSDVRVIPGGPFISIHANVLPVLSCVVMLFFAVRAFRGDCAVRRVGVVAIVLASVGIIAGVILEIVAFWREPFARGVLLGW